MRVVVCIACEYLIFHRKGTTFLPHPLLKSMTCDNIRYRHLRSTPRNLLAGECGALSYFLLLRFDEDFSEDFFVLLFFVDDFFELVFVVSDFLADDFLAEEAFVLDFRADDARRSLVASFFTRGRLAAGLAAGFAAGAGLAAGAVGLAAGAAGLAAGAAGLAAGAAGLAAGVSWTGAAGAGSSSSSS